MQAVLHDERRTCSPLSGPEGWPRGLNHATPGWLAARAAISLAPRGPASWNGSSPADAPLSMSSSVALRSLPARSAAQAVPLSARPSKCAPWLCEGGEAATANGGSGKLVVPMLAVSKTLES